MFSVNTISKNTTASNFFEHQIVMLCSKSSIIICILTVCKDIGALNHLTYISCLLNFYYSFHTCTMISKTFETTPPSSRLLFQIWHSERSSNETLRSSSANTYINLRIIYLFCRLVYICMFVQYNLFSANVSSWSIVSWNIKYLRNFRWYVRVC